MFSLPKVFRICFINKRSKTDIEKVTGCILQFGKSQQIEYKKNYKNV